MIGEVLRLLAAEGVSPEDVDDLILAEIADELGVSIVDVLPIITEAALRSQSSS